MLRQFLTSSCTHCGSLYTRHYLFYLYTQDLLYPNIFYECIVHCWKQDNFKRPSAEEVSRRLQNCQSSVMNKLTMKTINSISTIAIVSTNGVQCLWTVTGCPQDDPIVQTNIELMVIQQNHPSELDFVVRISHNSYVVCI